MRRSHEWAAIAACGCASGQHQKESPTLKLPRSTTPLMLLAAAHLTVTAANAQTNWASTISGSWLTAGNWTAGLPSATTDATLGLVGPYTVDISTGSASVRDLLIANELVELFVGSGRTLNAAGNITNAGQITVNPTGGATQAIISFNSPASMIDGTGTISLNAVLNINDAYLNYNASTNVITHGPNHTIEGSGQIYINLNNQGTINANVPGSVLQLRTTPKANSGSMSATNGGILDIESITITGPGLIRASTGSTVLASGTISGASIVSEDTGIVQTDGTLTIDDTLVQGHLHVLDNNTLNVTDSLALVNGTITVNPAGLTASSIISFNSPAITIAGPGSIVLNAVAAPNDAYLTYSASTNVVTSQVLITGSGEIYTRLQNENTVLADGAGKAINLRTTPKINNSDMIAQNGGELLFTSNVDQTGGGVLAAQNGGFLTFANMTLTGGQVESVGALARITGTTTFDGVTHYGPLDIADGVQLNVVNSITNNGSILVNDSAGMLSSIINFNTNGAEILGSGEIVLNADTAVNDAYLTYSASTHVITNTAAHTIRGSGQIYTNINNKGLISADVPGKTLELRTTNKKNTGVIRADGGTLNVLSVTIDQTSEAPGVMEAINGGTLALTGTILNGTLDAIGGLAVMTSTLTLDGVTLEGPLDIPGGFQLNVNNQDMTNNGTIHVNSNGSVSTSIVSINMPALTVGGTGEIVLDALTSQNDAYIIYSASTNVFTNGPDHTIAGNGIIYVKTTNEGTLSPGHALTGDLTQTFELGLSGDLTCTPTSIVEIDLEGTAPGQFDFITGLGPIDFVCDGTLDVSHVGGFTGPAWGTAIDIIDVGTVTGAFTNVIVPDLAGDDRYAIVYLADKVRLLVTCYADCDANLTLNIFDYICFGSAYAAMDPYADCDGNGLFNIFDYICFGSAYAVGCP